MSEHVSYLTGGTNQSTIDGASRIATAIYSRSGVLTYNDLEVTQRGAGADRSVDISAGQIVIGRGDYTLANQDSYFFGFNTAVYNLSLDTNTSGNSLITSIIAYIDTSMAVPDDNEGALKFIEVKGTPAGSPSAPTDSAIQTAVGAGVRWYRLADIELANNYSSVVDSDITDTRKLANARVEIVGSVSESSGVPTGAIVETGSNANGTYIKWADGTMICHVFDSMSSIAVDQTNGSLWRSSTVTWTFPAAFASAPTVTWSGRWMTGAGWFALATSTTTTAGGYYIDVSTRASGSCSRHAMAVGRWF